MNVVSTGITRRFLRRGAITSRIRVFGLSELGIPAKAFCARLAAAARSAPFDCYDAAWAAEKLVRDRLPNLYARLEQDWLRRWSTLHEDPGSDGDAGVRFWRSRVEDPELQSLLELLRAHRRRYYRRYLVARGHEPFTWRVCDLGTPVFQQKVTDARARIRRFAAPPPELILDPELLRLLGMICELVSSTPGWKPRRFHVTSHLMLTYAGEQGGEPAPEGMHQDGANYIVSAIVLERHNVIGGVSRIAIDRDGAPAIEGIALEEGQGLLQSDLDDGLWHEVSTIHRQDPKLPAYRSILGLDVTYT